MDISNKTLALFLLGAIVVSLGGTILSLNKLGDITTTGFVTGNVTLEIAGAASITTEDRDTIDFGTCTPEAATDFTINSETGADTDARCTGGNLGDGSQGGIFVRNNGNVDVNVTVWPSDVGAADGGSFLDSTQSSSNISVRSIAGGFDTFGNGCNSGLVGTYNTFTASGSGNQVLLCGELQFGSVDNSFQTHIQLDVPFDVPSGEQTVTLTFTAEEI